MVDMDILIIVVLILLLVYFKMTQRPSNFPPGPLGIPILGNLLQLGEAPYIMFRNWKAKYGPIIGIYFGSYRTVAISDYRLIKESLMEPALAGRPDMQIWHDRSTDIQARGIVFTQDAENVEQRKIALRCLKEFGNEKSFENVMTSEIITMLKDFDKTAGQPIKLRSRFHCYVLNILWHIVAGKDCEDDKGTLSQIYINTTKIIEDNNIFKALFMFIPWVCKYFPTVSGYSKVNTELTDIFNFFDKHIQEHKQRLDANSNEYHDFIGAYINEIKKATDRSSSFYNGTGEKSLRTSLLDLFFAGTDTVSNMFHWTALLLAVNPHIQQKFADEIDDVIGKSRLPEINDESKMPYTQALIQELLRYVTVTPMAIFHSAVQDVAFHGYDIKKDTMVMLNFYDAHHDQAYWGDPEVIRPERFLSSDGQTLIKHEAYFPFSAGKRICVGESVAKKEMFLFLTSIFQRFRVTTDPNNPNPSTTPIVTFVLLPPNHKLVFEKREDVLSI